MKRRLASTIIIYRTTGVRLLLTKSRLVVYGTYRLWFLRPILELNVLHDRLDTVNITLFECPWIYFRRSY
jgi:hypothetical protein